MANEITLVIRVDSSGSAEFQQFGKDAKDGMDTAAKGQEQFAMSSEQMARRAGLALAAVGAAIIAVGVQSTKAASEFDTSMREVNTLLDLPLDRFEELKSSVIDLDPALGSTTELVGGLYQTISAGIGDADNLGTSLEFIEIAATAAKAGLADVDTAVLAGSKTLKGFNLEADQSNRVFDVMFQTVRQGQTNFQDLATVAGDLASTAGVLNISLEENFGSLAELTLTAGSTSQAATQLSGIMRALIKPTESMSAALADKEGGLGFATGEAAIEALGFEEVLRRLVGTTDGTSVELGKLFTRAEGLTGLLALMQNDFEGVNSQIAGMADASGAAGRAFEEIRKSAGAQFEELSNRLERLGIIIGEKLLPFALKAVDGIEFLVDAFLNMGSAGQTVVVAVGGIAGAVSTVAGAFLALATPIKSALSLLGVGGAGGGAGAGIGAGLIGGLKAVIGFFTGPIGLTVAIGSLLLTWEPFRNLIVSTARVLFNLVKLALTPFVELIKIAWSLISPLVNALAELAGFIFGKLGDALNWAAEKLGNFADGIDAAINASAELESAARSQDELRESADLLNNAFERFGEEGLRTWLMNLDESVVSIDDLKAGLGLLKAELPDEEFEILRQALLDAEAGFQAVEESAGEAGDGLTNDFAPGILDVDDAISDFGFVTLPEVQTELANLLSVVGEGEIPTEQLRKKVEELRGKYKELDLLAPDVVAALDAITDAMDRQDEEAGILIGTTDEYAAQQIDLNAIWENTPGIITDVAGGMSLLQEMFGLNAIEAQLVTAATDDWGRQMEIARALTGELGESAQELAREEIGLNTALGETSSKTREAADGLDLMKEAASLLEAALNGVVRRGLTALGDKIGELFGGGGIGDLIGNALLSIGGQLLSTFGQGGQFESIFSSLGGIISGSQGIGSIVPALGSLFGGAGTVSGGNFATNLVGTATDLLTGGGGIGSIIGGLFGGGGGGAAITSSATSAFVEAGATVGATTGTGILSGIGGAISSGASAIGGGFASLAGTLAPLFTNPFTAVVGGAIAAFFGIKALFGGPDRVKQVGEEVGQFLGTGITDELAESIVKTSEALGGSRIRAIWLRAGDIIREQGVESGEVFSNMAESALQAFNIATDGAIPMGRAIDSATDTVLELSNHVDGNADRWNELRQVVNNVATRVREGTLSAADANQFYAATFPTLAQLAAQFGDEGVRQMQRLEKNTGFVIDKTNEFADTSVRAAEEIRAEYEAMYQEITNDAELSAEEQAKAIQDLTAWHAEEMKAIKEASAEAADDMAGAFREATDSAIDDIGNVRDELDRTDWSVSVDFDIGDIDPGGGGGGGSVPRLQHGGIVRQPTLAVVGDAPRGEAIMPLPPPGSPLFGGGGQVVNIGPIIVKGTGDPRETADKVLKEIGRRAALKGIRVSAVT